MGRSRASVFCLLLRVGLLCLLYSDSFVATSSALVTPDCLYFTSSNGKVWIGQVRVTTIVVRLEKLAPGGGLRSGKDY